MRVSELVRIRVGVRVGLLAAAATWAGCADSAADSAPTNGDDGSASATGGKFGGGNGAASGGTAGGTSTPPLPPEKEKESSFKLPVQSGRWVWSANPDSGRVSVIDTRSLVVQLARAGFAPTYLAALPAVGDVTSAAIVLNAKSDDATLLRRRESKIDSVTVPTHVGANSWAVSPGGRWAIAWSDATVVKDPDPADSFQDITVIDTSDPPSATRLSVGYRPNRIFFQDDESRAFVVSEPGISIVELAGDGGPSVSRDVPLTESPNDRALDVSVLPDGSAALFRVEGSSRLGIVKLPSGERTAVTLSGPITDLDLVSDGASAIAVVRGQPIVVGPSGTGGAASSGGSNGSGGTNGGSGGSSGGTGGSSGGTGGSSGGTGGSSGGTGGSSAGNETGGSSGGTAISAGGVSDEGGASGAGGSEDGFGTGGGGASGAQEDAGGAFGQGAGNSGGAGGDFEVGGQSAVGGSGADQAGAGGLSGEGGSPGGDMPPASGYGPSEVAVFSVNDVIQNPRRFDSVMLSDLVGSVAVSSDGTRAVLYTTVTELDRVTALDTDPSSDEYLTSRAVRVRAPVDAVFIAPDSAYALLALRAAKNATVPGAFGIVPLLAPLGVKVQPTDAPITGVAFAQSPSTSAILTAATGKTAYLVHFPALRVDSVPLPSLPLSAGIVSQENVGYVAQKHPDGRISLINLDTGEPRTLTGFELAGAVIDGN